MMKTGAMLLLVDTIEVAVWGCRIKDEMRRVGARCRSGQWGPGQKMEEGADVAMPDLSLSLTLALRLAAAGLIDCLVWLL
ncbi:hypothetical protein ACLOJK_006518, partial [Asimina triloba]